MIVALHQLLLDHKLSCAELTEWYLNAIKQAQPDLNAYISITADAARATAHAVDARIAAHLPLRPLEGIPMALKDNLATRDIPTTCASRMLTGYLPPYDASVWSFLQAQGAVLLGKTNMDEFAMGATGETSAFGGVCNPRAPEAIAGGSSSGSAAAVAGNLAAFSLGSDTGGSVRQPASFCGVVGLKPTYGAVSRYGLIAHASSLDVIGILAASIEDTALVFDAIAQPDRRDPTQSAPHAPIGKPTRPPLKRLRIGLPRQCFTGLDTQTSSFVNEALGVYRRLGVSFVELDMPILLQSTALYTVISSIEALSNLARYDGIRYGLHIDADTREDCIRRTRGEGFGFEVKKRLLFASHLLHENPDAYEQAAKLRARLTAAFSDAFSRCDLLLTPTTPMVAPARSDLYNFSDSDSHVVSASLAGLPALSFPCAITAGMPVGLQLIGTAYSEAMLLQTAYAYEQETGSGRQLPNIFTR